MVAGMEGALASVVGNLAPSNRKKRWI